MLILYGMSSALVSQENKLCYFDHPEYGIRSYLWSYQDGGVQ